MIGQTDSQQRSSTCDSLTYSLTSASDWCSTCLLDWEDGYDTVLLLSLAALVHLAPAIMRNACEVPNIVQQRQLDREHLAFPGDDGAANPRHQRWDQL